MGVPARQIDFSEMLTADSTRCERTGKDGGLVRLAMLARCCFGLKLVVKSRKAQASLTPRLSFCRGQNARSDDALAVKRQARSFRQAGHTPERKVRTSGEVTRFHPDTLQRHKLHIFFSTSPPISSPIPHLNVRFTAHRRKGYSLPLHRLRDLTQPVMPIVHERLNAKS